MDSPMFAKIKGSTIEPEEVESIIFNSAGRCQTRSRLIGLDWGEPRPSENQALLQAESKRLGLGVLFHVRNWREAMLPHDFFKLSPFYFFTLQKQLGPFV